MGNASSKRKLGPRLDKEIAVLKANTNLSEKEIRDIYEEFNYEAESGTGRMNKNQFRKYYKKIAGTDDVNDTLADHAFTVFDTDHNGSIDFSEFVLASAVGIKNDSNNVIDLDSALDLSFHMMDTSGDGYASYDEVVSFVDKTLKLKVGDKANSIDRNAVAEGIFNQFGLDIGQKIGEQQFINGCKKNQHLMNLFGPS